MLQRLSDQELIQRAGAAVRDERRANLAVLKHLQEIARRRLFLARGYPSLFEMCVKEFKYSAGAAQRRIEAMRLLNELPAIGPKIETGALSLSVVSRTQGFFRQERKEAREYSAEEKLSLLSSFEGKSTREVEKTLVAKNPDGKLRESVRAISETRARLTLTISQQLLTALDELKALRAHRNPGLTYEGLLELLAAEALAVEKKKNSPPAKRGSLPAPEVNRSAGSGTAPAKEATLPAGNAESPPPAAAGKRSRYVRAAARRKIWSRDGGCCSYVDPVSGRRCGSKTFLQLDHVEPFALGGETVEANLRLLCGAHNRERARMTFGEHER